MNETPSHADILKLIPILWNWEPCVAVDAAFMLVQGHFHHKDAERCQIDFEEVNGKERVVRVVIASEIVTRELGPIRHTLANTYEDRAAMVIEYPFESPIDLTRTYGNSEVTEIPFHPPVDGKKDE